MADYRELLKRYIATVRDAESEDFIEACLGRFSQLTSDDKVELRKLADESERDYPETALS